MMIYGLTHSVETGDIRDATQYYGKISTGYAAGEGPNKTNHPIQCGFYRILLKRQIRVPQSGGKSAVIEKWVENPVVHEKVGKEPTSLKFICGGRCPKDIWESRLAYWANGRIKCSGNGLKATFYEDIGDGTVIPKEIKCPHTECQYFKSDNCKAEGRLKVDLVDDYHLTSTYKLDTKSINSIMSIETSLNTIYSTIERLHLMSRRPIKEFHENGMKGMMLKMSLRQKKSGKNTVWVTYVEIPPETEKILTDALVQAMGRQQMVVIGQESPEVIKIEDSTEILAGDRDVVVENAITESLPTGANPVQEVVDPKPGQVMSQSAADALVNQSVVPDASKSGESVTLANKVEEKKEIKPDAASVLAKMQSKTPPISFNGAE